MSRLDRLRLENGVYPICCEIATRFADVDVLLHINNVAVAEILQEGRTRFAHAFDLVRAVQGKRVMVVSQTIEFAGEMHHPDPIQVSVGILEIGRSSYRIGQVARQNGTIGAYAETVLVAGDESGPVPIHEAWRRKLESLKIREPS